MYPVICTAMHHECHAQPRLHLVFNFTFTFTKETAMNQQSHQNNSQRIVFHDSILPLPELPGLAPNGLKLNHAGPGKDDAPMLLSFSFALSDDKQAALVKAVAEGQRIPYAEQLKDFATDRVQCQKLTQWL